MQEIANYIAEWLEAGRVLFVQAMGWFPADMPKALKAAILIALIVVIGRLLLAALELLPKVPSTLLRRFLLIWSSPFGRSNWASRKDIRRHKLLKKGGLFLGQWRRWWGIKRKDLYHHGEGHFCTIAAPGGGKSTAAIIPTLLECKTGSLVITDPKGELCAITRRHRETLGRVVYLNPFFQEFEETTGIDYPDTGFNPFDALENNQNLRTHADRFARLLCVTDGKDSNSYFGDEGAQLLSLFITWMVRHELPENQNLTYLYKLVRHADAKQFYYMSHANDPLIMDDVIRFEKMLKTAPQQWQGAISKAQLSTKRYVPTSPLSVHTSKSGFDPKWLKTENVTLYILVPTEFVEVAAPWLNLIVGIIGQAVGKAGKARPVTFLLDELPNLGRLPDLRSHMRLYRSSGLRMWLFSQTTAALSDPDMYGQEGLRDIMALCDTKQFFSIQDYPMAKEISELCGERAELNKSLGGNEATSAATVGVPLIRPEEIMRLKKGRQILIRAGMPPIKSWLIPYYTRKKWRDMTDQNPYR